MALCKAVCTECLRQRGLTLDRLEWGKNLRVLCNKSEDWSGDDYWSNIPIYKDPPKDCPFIAEHFVMGKE